MFCLVGRADAPSATMRVEMQTLAENMLHEVVVMSLLMLEKRRSGFQMEAKML
jgi:hypothetical protein